MLRKNLFYNSLLSVSQFIFPLVTFPYTTRILKPSGIGAVNFIDSFTQYFILFAALGIPVYGVREISKYKNNKTELSRMFNEIFLLHIISTFIFSIIYLALALLTPALKGHLDLVFIGIMLMFCTTFSIEWLFQGIGQFSYITKRTLLIRTLSIIFLFVFLKPGSPPRIYYLIITGIVLVNGLSNLYHLRKHVTFKIKYIAIRNHIKPLLYILGSGLAVSAYVLLDNVLLGLIKGVIAVGIYSTAVRIIRIPYAFINAINTVMVPEVSNAYYHGKFDEVQSCMNKSFSFICTIGWPVSLGLFISAPFVVHSFAGDQFYEAILTLKIITPVIMLVGFNSILNTQLLTPMGKEKTILVTVVIGMVFSILLNVCLIPSLSYIGAAITTILTEVLVTIISYRYVNKFISISFDMRIFFEAFLGAALFFPVAYFIRELNISYIIKEVTVIVSCILIYSLYLWFFMKNIYINNIKQLLLIRIKRKLVL